MIQTSTIFFLMKLRKTLSISLQNIMYHFITNIHILYNVSLIHIHIYKTNTNWLYNREQHDTMIKKFFMKYEQIYNLYTYMYNIC